MIQIITSVSEELFPYVTFESTAKVNKFLLESQKSNYTNFFNNNTIEKMITKNLYSLTNNKVIKLYLNYESIDYAKTLAYIYKVNVAFIYEWAYRFVNKI